MSHISATQANTVSNYYHKASSGGSYHTKESNFEDFLEKASNDLEAEKEMDLATLRELLRPFDEEFMRMGDNTKPGELAGADPVSYILMLKREMELEKEVKIDDVEFVNMVYELLRDKLITVDDFKSALKMPPTMYINFLSENGHRPEPAPVNPDISEINAQVSANTDTQAPANWKDEMEAWVLANTNWRDFIKEMREAHEEMRPTKEKLAI